MEGRAREVRRWGDMAGVEECDEGRHNNDNNMVTMTTLPLPLPPANDLKNKKNQLNWEDAVVN